MLELKKYQNVIGAWKEKDDKLSFIVSEKVSFNHNIKVDENLINEIITIVEKNGYKVYRNFDGQSQIHWGVGGSVRGRCLEFDKI